MGVAASFCFQPPPPPPPLVRSSLLKGKNMPERRERRLKGRSTWRSKTKRRRLQPRYRRLAVTTLQLSKKRLLPGRLFVGNLPFSMTSSELSLAFSEAGSVENVQVPDTRNQIEIQNLIELPQFLSRILVRWLTPVQIIYDKVTDQSRGFVFVTMATAEAAAKAIQMFDGAVNFSQQLRQFFSILQNWPLGQ
ncbi:hypothetical protein GUJ93_ZPchr0013g35929 [Zizania palustris]|uniref:RRM domain-containing protein n=1 Tax=Zizania palustris TaxID=103762 RepID=A0A8J5X3A5_ZIZPA|nr:hypothetical protein GUJ93_ZPchr0013g35929 [Zizania palustris]